MEKFKVCITGMAVVSQSLIIEAADMESARAKTLEPDTYNNGVWDCCGVELDAVQCDEVEAGY